MTATTRLFSLTYEIKNREDHDVPIDGFLELLQAQLDKWISSDSETFHDKFVPMPIHLKIQGPPRINERDFSGSIVVGIQSKNKDTIEMRFKAENCIYCWQALLIMPNPKLADAIDKCARKDTHDFLKYSVNKINVDFLNAMTCNKSMQNVRTKTQNQLNETIKNMGQLSIESNLYKFCHELISMPDGSERTVFTISEISSCIEKTINKRTSPKTLLMMVYALNEVGLFNPVKNTDYENPEFVGAIPLYEANEEYNNYLQRQKETKHEQKLLAMKMNLDRVRKEVTRLEKQLEQARLNATKNEEEIRQFELTK